MEENTDETQQPAQGETASSAEGTTLHADLSQGGEVQATPPETKTTGSYIPSDVKEEDPEYAKDLAERIRKSGYARSRIALSDYKKLHRAGLLAPPQDGVSDNKLVTGEKLVVDTREDAQTGTYYEVTE